MSLEAGGNQLEAGEFGVISQVGPRHDPEAATRSQDVVVREAKLSVAEVEHLTSWGKAKDRASVSGKHKLCDTDESKPCEEVRGQKQLPFPAAHSLLSIKGKTKLHLTAKEMRRCVPGQWILVKGSKAN